MTHAHSISVEEIQRFPEQAKELIAEMELRMNDLIEKEQIYLMALRRAKAELEDTQKDFHQQQHASTAHGFFVVLKLLAAGIAGVDTTPKHCSICRSEHGDEKIHTAE